MKAFFFFVVLFYLGLITAQNGGDTDDNTKVTFEKAQINKPLFGLMNRRYEKYIGLDNEIEKLYWLTVTVKIENFSNSSNFTFNCNAISLVDSLNLIRHRPRMITVEGSEPDIFGDRTGHVPSLKIENSGSEDLFLKYSQKGIRDYDHYIFEPSWGKKAYRYRFGHVHLYKKQGKDILLFIVFPTRVNKSENFALYYKDQLIKNFTL